MFWWSIQEDDLCVTQQGKINGDKGLGGFFALS